MTRLAELLHPGDRDPMTRSEARFRASRTVTLVGALVNLLLAAVKVAVGIVANSQALVADGIHSLSDLFTDFVVLLGAWGASKEPDARHPYGHGRAETAMTLVLGAVLLATAAGIGISAGEHLQHGAVGVPSMMAIWVAVLSIVANEGLYYYTAAVARRIDSKLLRANAWHHRSDSISSAVVLVGVGGALLGYGYMDAVAAVVVAVMIAKVGWDAGWGAVRELLDEALSNEQVKQIRQLISSVAGVRDLHMLRTRSAGPYALVDVHVIVEPKLTVSEGHRIAERIRQRVVTAVDQVADVLVHIDSEDDQGALQGRHLPLRDEMVRIVRAALAASPIGQEVQEIRLHYLRDTITLEMMLPLADRDAEQARRDAAALRDLVADLPHISDVRLFYSA